MQYRLLSGTAQEGDDAYFPSSAQRDLRRGRDLEDHQRTGQCGDFVAEPDEAVVLEVFSASGGAALAGMRRRCGRPAGSSTTMAAATSWRCSPRGRWWSRAIRGQAGQLRSEPVAAGTRSLLGELHDGRWQRARGRRLHRDQRHA